LACKCTDTRTFRPVSEITVVPTYACFFDCTYCFVDKNLVPTRKNLTKKKMRKIIEFFMPERVNRPFTLWFFGGEPLMMKDLVVYGTERALEAGRAHGIQVTVGATTNGYLLDTDFIEWCRETGFRLLISYDGYHNQRIYRGREGRREEDAEVVEENIRRFHGTEIGRTLAPTAALQLPPGGLDHLYENVISAFDLGFSSVAMNKITGRAGGYSDEDFRILRGQLDRLAGFVVQERRKSPGPGKRRIVEFLEKQVGYLCDTSFLGKQVFHHDKSCGAAKGSLSIGPDGQVYPCQRLHYTGFSLGNVVLEMIDPDAREALASHRPATCFSCEARCAPCYASNFETSGDIDAIPVDECRYQKMLLASAFEVSVQTGLRMEERGGPQGFPFI
jgi:radical SAM protein with 4Fe4S-binding SPASM domain